MDIVAPIELGVEGGDQLLAALQAAGFEECVSGADRSVHKYVLSAGGGAYVQYLAPLAGSGELPW